jgi:hypothetical protein
VRKARRVGGQLDAEADEMIDAGLDRLHEVVSAKMGRHPVPQELVEEAGSGTGQVSELTRQQVELALMAAARVGARPTGRSASTPMRRSPASSPRSSSGSRSPGRCARHGCGCVARACGGRCRWSPIPPRQRDPGDHLGGTDLPRGPHHADPPGLRRRIRLRPDPQGTLP